ncbi:thiamine-phosphate kinase, partial [Microbacterium arthrosphaerae]
AEASDVTIALESATLGGDVEDALAGGEDHALLATFPVGRALPHGFTRIGSVHARGADRVLVDGRPYVGRGGWDPYLDWDSRTG